MTLEANPLGGGLVVRKDVFYAVSATLESGLLLVQKDFCTPGLGDTDGNPPLAASVDHLIVPTLLLDELDVETFVEGPFGAELSATNVVGPDLLLRMPRTAFVSPLFHKSDDALSCECERQQHGKRCAKAQYHLSKLVTLCHESDERSKGEGEY